MSRRSREERRLKMARRRRQSWILGSITAAAVVAGLVATLATRGSKPPNLNPVALPSALGSADQNLPPVAIREGGLFPEFRVTDVDGKVLTRESLLGKPAIVWFTTSYCRPCQIGARVVAKLDRELGGKVFNVLVLFVDPSEGAGALRDWRSQFGTADWMVAPDTSLARAVSLQALDTKFLLDSKGVIRNIDLNIADDRYVGQVRGVVGA